MANLPVTRRAAPVPAQAVISFFEEDDQLPQGFEAYEPEAGDADINNAASEGIAGNFPVLSVKGKVFGVKHNGEEEKITNDRGEAVQSIETVIVGISPRITKQYYAEGYVDGASEAPDCWSSDGKTPDAAVENPQNAICASCPMNRFGSRISADGTAKGKACGDTRRVAVVPLEDMRNKRYGGPMLVRISPTGLRTLSTYAAKLKGQGYPINGVATRIGFDNDLAYPSLVFKPMRPLSKDERAVSVELGESDETRQVLALDVEPAKEDSFFEQPTPPTEAVPANRAAHAAVPGARPAARPTAAPAAPVAKAPAPRAPATVAVAPSAPAKAPAQQKPVTRPTQAAKQAPAPETEQEEAAGDAGEASIVQDIDNILAELGDLAT